MLINTKDLTKIVNIPQVVAELGRLEPTYSYMTLAQDGLRNVIHALSSSGSVDSYAVWACADEVLCTDDRESLSPETIVTMSILALEMMIGERDFNRVCPSVEGLCAMLKKNAASLDPKAIGSVCVLVQTLSNHQGAWDDSESESLAEVLRIANPGT